MPTVKLTTQKFKEDIFDYTTTPMIGKSKDRFMH